MKQRCEFMIHQKDHRAVAAFARSKGSTASDFYREAVSEKLSREQLISRFEQVEASVQSTLDDLRNEVARLRLDLIGDHDRAKQMLRDDMGKSAARVEELLMLFLRNLGPVEEHTAPSGNRSSTSPSTSSRRPAGPGSHADKHPKPVPG